MLVIQARNVNEAYTLGLGLLNENGIRRDSRAGEVITLPYPVTTAYLRPMERILFCPIRDANPFFHLLESLWMLAGRNDTHWITQILPSMQQFSDDGKTFHGAYGHRWRKHFGIDQIIEIAEMLRKNPNERRAVLQMWDPVSDLGQPLKDVPCNTAIYFRVNPVSGHLDMTVSNRSNDVIWGAYGANAVHMSVLMELVAALVGVQPGIYYQMSNDYHAYSDVFLEKKGSIVHGNRHDLYASSGLAASKIVDISPDTWLVDLDLFFEDPFAVGFRSRFFRRVAKPMFSAIKMFKDKSNDDRKKLAMEILDQGALESDWIIAGRQWIGRRMTEKKS